MEILAKIEIFVKKGNFFSKNFLRNFGQKWKVHKSWLKIFTISTRNYIGQNVTFVQKNLKIWSLY